MGMISLDEFHPKSELRVPEHDCVMPPCPVIDMHTHFGPLLLGEEYESVFDTREVCARFRDLGLKQLFCLELQWGAGLDRLTRKLEASRGMILPVGSVDVSRALEADFDQTVWHQVRDLKARGGVAVKLWKNMTLWPPQGSDVRLALDDPRYEAIWQACGEVGLPIIIHVADPPCFFRPTTPENEHYICLTRHPEWSFCHEGIPSFEEHMRMQEAIIKNHPGTTFVVAHVGSYAEDLSRVAEWLDRYPNMNIDVAARLDQLGRQPYTARAFIEKYSDRVLFGTDFDGNFGAARTDAFYHTHYRFFQTRDEYFDHPFPDFLGQWKIFGIDLSGETLERLYHANAERLFKL